MAFLDEVVAGERGLDARCSLVHALYALMEDGGVPVPSHDKAAHAVLDSGVSALKVGMADDFSIRSIWQCGKQAARQALLQMCLWVPGDSCADKEQQCIK